MSRWIVGITGASGAIYARRLIQVLKDLQETVDVVISQAGEQVIQHEKETQIKDLADHYYRLNDWFSPPASGSSAYAGMVLIPCSMGTLGKVASGIADNLLVRAADVCLKENRRLVIVPREMPLSVIHLENMLRIRQSGGVILPACPYFYQHPQSIEDLVDTVIVKVLDQLGVPHSMGRLWGEKQP